MLGSLSIKAGLASSAGRAGFEEPWGQGGSWAVLSLPPKLVAVTQRGAGGVVGSDPHAWGRLAVGMKAHGAGMGMDQKL